MARCVSYSGLWSPTTARRISCVAAILDGGLYGRAMRRASVGTTGIELSAIGLGGFELGETSSDVPAARAAVAAAMESGVNWVDTADSYHATANESVIGEALGGLPERPLISSKRCPHGDSFSPAGIH